MNLWIFSDLHQDFGKFDLPIPQGVDVAVVAGDVQNDDFLIQLGSQLPTIFVAGNHEFYGHCHDERLAELRSLPAEQLYVLDNDTLTLDWRGRKKVRFIGATLWTDYGRNPVAADVARRSMNDHRRIKWSKEPYQRFIPSHATGLHEASKEYISEHANIPFDGETVIVTHHAPHEGSVAEKYRGDILNYAYFSDLTSTIDRVRPRLWVHGHVHSSFDYVVGETRIICNPHGYPGENALFNPGLVVEI